jgi:hypothetical protein
MRSVSNAFLSILCAALVSPASADNDKAKGNSHGGPKAGKYDNDRGRGDNDDRGNSGGPDFDRHAANPVAVVPYQQIVIVDSDRNVVRTYYRTEYAAGRCPPGLARKNSGGGSQRGIEVTVQKDDGQTVVVAQADNGDVQMGDRVRIVQDRNGVASAIRDSGYRRDL